MNNADFKIREARVFRCKAPLITPFRIATGQHDIMENIFLKIDTDKGWSGFGEAAIATHITGETPEQTVANLERAANALNGRAVTDLSDLIEEFRPRFAGNHAALAAFEMALMDTVARTAGIPLRQLFSPPENFSESLSFSTDITIVIGTIEEASERTQHFASRGFNSFKIKIGKDYELDLQRVMEVHRIAPGSSIILDANMGFTADAMLAFLDRLERKGVVPSLIEQPVPRQDWDGLSAVTRGVAGSGSLVCADETVRSLADAERAITTNAVTAINIKFMKTGISESGAIARLACKNGIKLMIGAMMESSVAITAAAHFAAAMGCFDFIDLDTTFFIKGPFAQSPCLDDSGRFDLSSTAPGIGFNPPLHDK